MGGELALEGALEGELAVEGADWDATWPVLRIEAKTV
jgi:hypothetical protein